MLQKTPRSQHGAVLLIMMIILVMGAAAMLLNSLNSTTPRLARDQVTAAALAQAKEALIGYAIAVDLSSGSKRPGDLPCPDLHPLGHINEGSPSTPCNSNALGRLPWKKLGLPDLRDSSGERLWYAVSTNFKDSTRIGTLNSDTFGTISVFSSDGVLIHDGSGSSGAVAIIIAPGEVLTRQGASSAQDRSSTGYLTATNYLDTPTALANPKDNASFIDSSSTDGFIQGKIKNTNGDIILNDQILVITHDNMMQSIHKRVIGEVENCLDSYSAAYNGRYPWAAPITDITNYFDISNTVFGRIPNKMDATKTSASSLSNEWPATCATHTSFTPNSWWLEWRDLVFYGLSDKYKPDNAAAPVFATTCATAGNCININNSSTPAKYVVIISGKKLTSPDQSLRTANTTNAFYYLEGGNENATQSGAYTFTHNASSATFNDSMIYK
jgi:hypothetical protein